MYLLKQLVCMACILGLQLGITFACIGQAETIRKYLLALVAM